MFNALLANFELEDVLKGGVLAVRDADSRVADPCWCVDIHRAETFGPATSAQLAGRLTFAAYHRNSGGQGSACAYGS